MKIWSIFGLNFLKQSLLPNLDFLGQNQVFLIKDKTKHDYWIFWFQVFNAVQLLLLISYNGSAIIVPRSSY